MPAKLSRATRRRSPVRRFDPAKLLALRTSRGWSLATLGRLVNESLNDGSIGPTAPTIVAWESGESIPNTNYFLGLCRAFDVLPEALTTTKRTRTRAAS